VTNFPIGKNFWVGGAKNSHHKYVSSVIEIPGFPDENHLKTTCQVRKRSKLIPKLIPDVESGGFQFTAKTPLAPLLCDFSSCGLLQNVQLGAPDNRHAKL
jgi:hypothetical protein